MRICHVGTGFSCIPPDCSAATETVVYGVARALAKKGLEVRLVDIEGGMKIDGVEKFEFNDIFGKCKSESLKLVMKRLYFSLSSYKTVHRMEGFLFHYHNQFPAFVHNVGRTMDYVYTLHNPLWCFDTGLIMRSKYILEGWAIRMAKGVIALNRTQAQNIVSQGLCNQEKVEVIENGVDTEFFRPYDEKKKEQMRERMGVDKHILLCVGRICPIKNQLTIVDAMRSIPNTRCILLGPMDDISYVRKIREFAKRSGVGLSFAGEVKTSLLSDYYNMADIVVLPSLAEGSPLALLEAMSCGRPCIASRIPGVCEIAEKGGVMSFDLSERDGLRCNIELLLQDEKLREDMGKKARENVIRNYTWDKVADRTMEFYKKVVEWKR